MPVIIEDQDGNPIDPSEVTGLANPSQYRPNPEQPPEPSIGGLVEAIGDRLGLMECPNCEDVPGFDYRDHLREGERGQEFIGAQSLEEMDHRTDIVAVEAELERQVLGLANDPTTLSLIAALLVTAAFYRPVRRMIRRRQHRLACRRHAENA